MIELSGPGMHCRCWKTQLWLPDKVDCTRQHPQMVVYWNNILHVHIHVHVSVHVSGNHTFHLKKVQWWGVWRTWATTIDGEAGEKMREVREGRIDRGYDYKTRWYPTTNWVSLWSNRVAQFRSFIATSAAHVHKSCKNVGCYLVGHAIPKVGSFAIISVNLRASCRQNSVRWYYTTFGSSPVPTRRNA